MAEKQLSVLIIGAGNKGAFGPVSHAQAFRKAGFKILGFVDPVRGTEASMQWGGEAFENIEEAFDKLPEHKADITVVAVPDGQHYEAIKQASMRDCGLIFAEKPFTKSLSEAQEILDNFGHFTFAVNYTRRFSPIFQEIAGLIRDGDLGDFLGGSGFYGNGLFHNGSHMIDMLRMLVGEVTVPGPGAKIIDAKEDDPSVYGVIMVAGSPFYLGVIPRPCVNVFEATLYFSGGAVKISDIGTKIEVSRTVPRSDFPEDLVYTTSFKGADARSPMMVAVQNIKDHLTHGTPLLSTAENAIEVLKVCQGLAS